MRQSPGCPWPAACCLPGRGFGTKAEPQVGHEVAVIDVAGASGFMRVVADLGSLLLAVEGLYCAVDVEDPRQREHGLEAQALVFGKPVEGRLLINDVIERMAHDIIADDLSDAQQACIDGVAANGVHVQVSPVAAEHGEGGRAEDIAGTAAAVACIAQRTVT